MPPAATFCQSRLDDAVGRAANERNEDGSTPIMATNVPFTWIRAASSDAVAVTPGSRRIAVIAPRRQRVL